MTGSPRSTSERIRDAQHRLDHDIDAWIATADGDAPYLVPLSFLWDRVDLLVATPASTPTARNLRHARTTRIGIGPTRDVVLVDATVQALSAVEIPGALAERFAARVGFDPRKSPDDYEYFRLHPQRIQAWREANEFQGRELMRHGRWLEQPAPADPTPPAAQYAVTVIGEVRSPLRDPTAAPKQGSEGGPDAVVEIDPAARPALHRLSVGDEVILITWLHRARRDLLQVHPRDDPTQPMTGVFATRSADRPNPIGLHQVTIRSIGGRTLTVGPLEAIDGTPVIDIKPVLPPIR